MCCRIFNTSNPTLPVTGRNMNWLWPLDAHLFINPANVTKQGLSDAFAESQGIKKKQMFYWTAKYTSVSTIMSGVHLGSQPLTIKPYSLFEQACADGMNEKGLAVNALADVEVDYGEVKNKEKLLSSLRWAQYILDTYANVEEAIQGLADPEYKIINQGIPDKSEKQGKFHICLSDSDGHTAIIEYENGQPNIYCKDEYKVATNQPSYSAQLTLNEYWQFQWGLSETANLHPVQTVPGGHSSTQMFEQASYNLAFSLPMATPSLAIAQTRALMTAVAPPVQFNKKKHESFPAPQSVYTTWINLAAHHSNRYYFINYLVGNGGYLKVPTEASQPMKVQVMAQDIDNQEQFEQFNADLVEYLAVADETPFQRLE